MTAATGSAAAFNLFTLTLLLRPRGDPDPGLGAVRHRGVVTAHARAVVPELFHGRRRRWRRRRLLDVHGWRLLHDDRRGRRRVHDRRRVHPIRWRVVPVGVRTPPDRRADADDDPRMDRRTDRRTIVEP